METLQDSVSLTDRAALDRHLQDTAKRPIIEAVEALPDEPPGLLSSALSRAKYGAYALQGRTKLGEGNLRRWFEPYEAVGIHLDRLLAKTDYPAMMPYTPPEPAPRPAPPRDVPAKVSEVKAWLAAHPAPDPSTLGYRAEQTAAERVAAFRALGMIASPEALEVMEHYALLYRSPYSEAMLKELHRAWGRFDRAEFAAAVLRPDSGWAELDLGVTPSLEGIGAVPGLERLHLITRKGALDLAPLAAAKELREFRIRCNERGPASLEPLLELPALHSLLLQNSTLGTDLGVLTRSQVRYLVVALDDSDGALLLDMPQLRWVTLSVRAKDQLPPHQAGLPDLVLELARRGVEVIVYTHQDAWVPELRTRAEADPELHVRAANGYVGLWSGAAERPVEPLPSNLQTLRRRSLPLMSA